MLVDLGVRVEDTREDSRWIDERNSLPNVPRGGTFVLGEAKGLMKMPGTAHTFLQLNVARFALAKSRYRELLDASVKGVLLVVQQNVAQSAQRLASRFGIPELEIVVESGFEHEVTESSSSDAYPRAVARWAEARLQKLIVSRFARVVPVNSLADLPMGIQWDYCGWIQD
jgi:hypothetical protein